MRRLALTSVLALSAIAVTLNSCKKEEPDTETQSAVDNNICETEFTKLHSTSNGFAINEQGIKGMHSVCYTIISPDTVASPGWPRTMTIDYGTTGCTDSIDGKTRKGKIHLTLSNRWHIIGTSMKITLENYSVDGVTIACDSVKVIHSGTASFTNRVYNGKCISPNWNLEWSSDRTLTQVGGLGDLNPFNDVFKLSGNANGKNREGKTYSVNIVTDLIKRSTCKWIESGRLELVPEGLSSRTIDFGDGTCDSQATLTIDGNNFTFTMN
jgi:hypothetical protein